MKNKIKEYRLDGKVIGTVFEDELGMYYESHRNRERHYMRKYKGWGIEKWILKDLTEFYCNTVRLIIDNEGILEVSVEDYLQRGFTDTFEGFGTQQFLAEKHFHWFVKGGVHRLDAF